jgi:hypothetical protein
MKIAKTFVSHCLFFGTLAVLLGLSPLSAHSQTGRNAVYKSSSLTTPSASFIDLVVATTTGDICQRINDVLNGISLAGSSFAGMVVDARGFGSGTSQPCASNPFLAGMGHTIKPSTILLPSGTITIQSTWILPDQTRVFGEGPGQTTLLAHSSFTSPMMQMGISGSSGCTCFQIVIAHLTLDGAGQNIDGIDNINAEEQSAVDDVAILHIEGTALSLGSDTLSAGTSSHSGPYTNLFVQANGTGVTTLTTTACVRIIGFKSQPRGIHGITCIADGTPSAAIYLDGDNVSIEDARIDGFGDGIVLGAQGSSNTVQGDVIFNVTGTNVVGAVSNLIHLCGSGSASPCPSAANTVNNVTIMGVTSAQNNTIKDDVTGTTLPFSTDVFVGMYALGQSLSGGYSRFSTSPRTPTWGIGSLSSSIASASCAGTTTPANANGSLFSNTNTSVTPTLFACVGGLWHAVP